MNLWRWFLAFLTLGILPDDDDPKGDGQSQDDPPPDDEEPPPDEESPDDDEPPPEEAPPPKKTGADPEELRAAQERNRQLEVELEVQRRQSQPQTLTEDQRRWAEEEARLKDPKLSPNERWQIDSNRVLRESKRQSAAALAQATDTSDRTAFELKCSQNKRLNSVKAEVETEHAKLRAAGNAPPREALAMFLLGKKLVSAPEQKKPAASVDRGKSPGARSDVSAKGKQSEREKRMARLQNVQI